MASDRRHAQNRSGREPPRVADLAQQLEACMLLDRFRLGRRLRALGRKRHRKAHVDRERARLTKAVHRSQARRAKREEKLPVPAYPEELPVSQRRGDIRAALAEHRVLIVAGETGSGKTTQLPKICLELGRGVDGMIGVTQPRRIAAMSVADRVASELETPVGHAVGYQIRFDARVRPDTYIKFMTDGILLAETRQDRGLRAYDTIIIDEAHERTLNIDFLLGYLKRLLQSRPELRVIVSSATLDVERFSHFFANAPVLAVEGRTFPVDVQYRPPAEDDPDWPALIAHTAVDLLGTHETGDILAFLPTEQDIRETAQTLAGRNLPGTVVLPLFGRMPATEQRRVFQPMDARRIVLATNVAETSITVPGIRFVIDTGLARVRRFLTRTQVDRLQIERVSRASADQRAGRCGRLGPGVCVRLYAEEDYLDRARFTDPEIKRTSLASVILQMKDLRLGAVEAFPFLDPPFPRAVQRGYDELAELGALDDRRRLTDAGRRMARLPLEPRMSRMLLAAAEGDALAEALIIVAALDLRDPRERPFDKRDEADAAHRRFLDPDSDFQAWLNLWAWLNAARERLPSNNQFRKFCRAHFLAYRRVREWFSVHEQLGETMADMGFRQNREPATYEALHQAILAGLLSRLGRRTDKHDYQGAHDTRFALWPGSGLARKRHPWVMAAELVETRRLFGRCAARISPAWAESLAGSLCKRTYLDPHWDGRTGKAQAFEQVTVYGLPIVERRRVHYGPVNPPAARKLLIREGLMKGDLETRLAFFHHNQALVAEVEAMEHKGRRRDLLVDRERLFAFYDERLPEDIVTLRQLERWFHKLPQATARSLFLRRKDIQLFSPDGITPDRFPPEFAIGELRLPLRYRFAPGEEDDGVTCAVPVATLPQLDGWRFAWLVPGLLGEKVALLLRSLPRTIRRGLVPIPESVEHILPRLHPGAEPLPNALAREVGRRTGRQVTASAFRPETLPPFLCMRYEVQDHNGDTVAAGRDIDALREQFHQETRDLFTRAPKDRWERTGITAWDFEALPDQVELSGARGEVSYGFPALQDEGESVAIRVFPSPEEADWVHRLGLRRLIALVLAAQIKNTKKSLPLSQEAELSYAALGGDRAGLRDDVILNALEQAFLADEPLPRTAAAFEERLASGKAPFFAASQDLARAVDALLPEARRLRSRLDTFTKPVFAAPIADAREQLDHLVSPGFLRHTPFEAVRALPRYLQALSVRLDRLAQAPAKDHQRCQKLAPLWQLFLETEHKAPARVQGHPAFVRFRWMLEEFRVSLFAQEMGTAEPVSPKRLRAQWEKVVPLLED